MRRTRGLAFVAAVAGVFALDAPARWRGVVFLGTDVTWAVGDFAP